MRNIIVIGYPKSGNTWVNWLLASYFNAEFVETEQEERYLSGEISVHRIPYKSEDNLQGKQSRSDYEREVSYIVKSHVLPDRMCERYPRCMDKIEFTPKRDTIVMLCRDPRDVITSYFFYIYFNKVSRTRSLIKYIPYEMRYRYHVNQSLPILLRRVSYEWSSFTQKVIERHKPYVIRYEDLLDDAYSVIEGFVRRHDFNLHPCYLRQAITSNSFSKMMEKEKEASSRHPNERFFRNGRSGDWKELLDAKQAARVTDVAGPAMRRLGYEVPNSGVLR